MKGNLTNLVTTFLSAPLRKLSPHKLLLQAWNSIVLYFVFFTAFSPGVVHSGIPLIYFMESYNSTRSNICSAKPDSHKQLTPQPRAP